MQDATIEIVVIDDDAILRHGLAIYLADSGFSVREAPDGQAGLALCAKAKPDLVLCDLRMPGMDGLDVLGNLVATHPELPVIILTGQGVLQDAISALRRGAWDFLTKPILDYDMLDWSIERALERARLMRENVGYRAHLEREVEAKTEEYRASETRLAAVLDSLHEAFVLVFDRAGTIVQGLGTRELEQRHGVFAESLMDGSFVAMFAPEAVAWHTDAVARVVGQGEIVIGATPAQFPRGIAWLECTYSPIRGKDGIVEHVLGFARDITRRRAAEREAKRLEGQARQSQKMEALGTLAGGIAHDFNNMLSVILGFSDLAQRQAVGHPTEGPLREIQSAGRRAADLVRQILAFSRRADVERAPVELAPVIKEALRLLRASLPSNIELRQDIASVGSALGDLTQFHQLILNLGSNAYHAMRGMESGVLHVVLQAAAQGMAKGVGLPLGEYIHLRVTDTGSGIPANAMEHIFEPFYTTKEVGEGTGMGLAIVHGIVTSCGGAIRAANRPEGGAAFDIYLPHFTEENAAAEVEADVVPRGSARLLVVDDEPACARLWKRWLESYGYTVVAFNDSAEALAHFKESKDQFDLVLSDFLMPRLTGIALAREIHTINPTMPIVLLSGAADLPEDEHVYAEVGIRERLSKPIAGPDLATAIARVLNAVSTKA